MAGHIKLGAVGYLRDYMIQNLNLYSKSPANQFAAKLSTGGGNYDDLQNWSYFVMDDWRGGVGKKDPEGGGFLYGELESRYSNRLTLPMALSLTVGQSEALNYGWQVGADVYPNDTLTIGTTQDIYSIAHAFKPANTDVLYVTVWIDGLDNEVSVGLYSSTTVDGRRVPFGLIAQESFYPDGVPGAKAYNVIFPNTLSSSNYYHIVIAPNNIDETLTLPITTYNIAATDEFSTYDGLEWTGGYTEGAFPHGLFYSLGDSATAPKLIYFPASGQLYTVDTNLSLYTKADDASEWASVATLDNDVTDFCVVGDELWIAQGAADNFAIMDAAESISDGGVAADLFLVANGYVWRSVGGDVYYTGDGSTWTGPIAVTWNGHEVRSMAAMQDYIYCATDDGLYYIGFGDEVGYVTSWPSIDSSNGVGMINHQGQLFIPIQHALYRYDGTSMLPIGLDMGEGLPQDRIGEIAGLVSLNNWLVAYLAPTETTDRATVWAYNDQGWHYLAGLPFGMRPVDATYDITKRRLYFVDQFQHVWQLPTIDSANFNNLSLYDTHKMPQGFMETDWFFGNLIEVQKDIESLYVTGDGIDRNHTVKVYWKDDDSEAWEYLGLVDSGRVELRWSDYDVRPNTRQIKLGFLLSTVDDDAPVVRGVRLKYHPMVSDWFRWSFPLLLSDRQEVLEGEINIYNRAEMEEHLDGLIRQVPPLIYQDLNGIEYEVKVMGCQIQILDYEYLNDGPHYNAIYNLTIEQIRSEEYN